MKVQMKIQIEGTRNGLRWPAPGGEIELTEGEALDLIGLGYASVVAAPAKPEKAVAAKPETRKKA